MKKIMNLTRIHKHLSGADIIQPVIDGFGRKILSVN